MKYVFILPACLLLFTTSLLSQSGSANKNMVNLLASISEKISSADNPFSTKNRIMEFTNGIASAQNTEDSLYWQYLTCQTLLELGEEDRAIMIGEQMLQQTARSEFTSSRSLVRKLVAIAYLRLGERINCITDHNVHSCIFPISGKGVQADTAATRRAIDIYLAVLKDDPSDWESRWLLNIAFMAIGQYPQQVPQEYMVPNLNVNSENTIRQFEDMSMDAHLNISNMAGGSIVEDFDNDGFLDVVTSGWGLEEGMHYFKNEGNGKFEDLAKTSGLGKLTGGLHIQQTDYNNDGFKDIFVLRGAWMGTFGEQPNSLLRNNGNGTFTDVTEESGLLSFHPTQTATWADFNNDGWLDLFIGNETSSKQKSHPCELYLNNGNGTFRQDAKAAGVDFSLFTKGVTSGDFDNDGDMDLFLSSLDGRKVLLQNNGKKGAVSFKNITHKSGLDQDKSPTFSTWFWDYDNDGWLDILCASYDFGKSLSWYAGQEASGVPIHEAGRILLYRNQGNGKFKEVGKKSGLGKMVFAMGGNFGDIDNDGFPDMYFGTGNPSYHSLIPNKLFLNKDGKGFSDVTTAARVGSLQKGHGVSFADIDNDGDEDIYIEMGGAFLGDAYQNSLFINPGQNQNEWIKISLEGTTANRAAIGTRIKVVVENNGKTRSIFREVNSGGSFGANPLMQHIGIGSSSVIKEIEIRWPGGKTNQYFRSVNPGQHILIKEGSAAMDILPARPFNLRNSSSQLPPALHDMHGGH